MKSANRNEIRETNLDEIEKLIFLYSNAFPAEDLSPLINQLHNDSKNVFSFVIEEQQDIIGHICFSLCYIKGHEDKLALLGPLAVLPVRQKQGIGSLLINFGMKFLTARNYKKVLVLGDPNYYGRYGFLQEGTIMPPYPIPEEWQSAWQSITLSDININLSGKLIVPQPWQNPKLWSD